MATQEWLYGASGDWSNASNWVSGTVPGPADNVTINSYGHAITVTNSGDVSVNSLDVINQAITNNGSIATASDLTMTGSISGTGSLSVGGATTLSGSINLSSETFKGTVNIAGDNSIISSNGGIINLDSGIIFNGYNAFINLLNGANLISDGQIIFNQIPEGIYLSGGTITALAGITSTVPFFVNSDIIISGYGQIDGNVTAVALNAQQGILALSGTYQGGSATIASGATLDLGGASNSSIAFAGPNATLKLDNPVSFTGTIANMSLGDTIDLSGIAVSGLSYNGTTLTVTETNGQTLSLAVSGSGLTGTAPTFQTDSSGGTDISWVQTPLSVSSLSVSTDNGTSDLNAGHVVTITLVTTEPTVITGTPTLQLNNGGQAVYSSGSGTNSLTFTYTVQPGQDTADLTTAALAGGSITDQAGHLLGGLSNQDLHLQIDTTTPTATAAVASPSTGVEQAGQNIQIAVTFSEAVRVSGTAPSLTLNDGGTATYVGGSGSNTLTFSYKVGAGDASTSALAVTGVSNAGSVSDAAGNAANFATAERTFAGLQISTSPTVTAVEASPSTGDGGIGKVIPITVTFSKQVTVSGAGPTLQLNDGGVAAYATGSGTNTLTFNYTVSSTDASAAALAVTGVTNGASVTDSANIAADFSGANTTFTGLQIDTATPGVAVSLNSSDVNLASNTATVTFAFNEAPTDFSLANTSAVGGTLSNLQQLSPTTYTATFTAAAGTDIANGSVSVNTGWHGAAGNPGTAATSAAFTVDTIAPIVSQAAATPSSGDEGIGKAIPITLTFSEPVTVSGANPALTLNDGGVATYVGGSGTDTLTFSYSVSSSDKSVPTLAVTGVTNASSVTNSAGNTANVSAANTTFNGLQISTPTLTTLASFDGANGASPYGGLITDAAGDLFGTTRGGANGRGAVFEIAKTSSGYSAPITLASFDGANGALPVGSLISDPAGDLFGMTSEGGANNNGTVFEITKTSSGYSAPITLASFDGVNGSYPDSGLISDPAGDLFGMTNEGGANYGGTVFEIAKTSSGYSAPITLASFDGANGASPVGSLISDPAGDLFGMTNGGGAGGTGTVFEIAKTSSGYSAPITLASFDGANGAYPSGGLISDPAGDLFGMTNEGGANNNGTVFEVAKTSSGYGAPITLASFDVANGAYPSGGLTIDAAGDLFGTTSEGGANNNGTVFEIAKTSSGYSASITLASSNGVFSPLGGLISDAAGNLFGFMNATGTNNGSTVFEITNSGFQVAPTVSITSIGVLTNQVTQSVSGTVTAAPGQASVGGTATLYDNGTQIGTATVNSDGTWSTTVKLSGEGSNNITATNTDAAGNTGTSTAVSYTLDTVAPTLSKAAATPSSGDEGIGEVITISLTFSEPVNVAGATPSLQLNDGGTASYQGISADGQTLTFTYTVSSSNTSVDALAITGVTNASSVADAAANAASFGAAITTFTGPQIDTTVPAITSLVASPSNGAEQVGSTVTITVQLSEAVTVAGGTPALSLNDGGVATYSGGSGTNTLAFTYKVGATDTSLPALAVTMFNLNGATITDAAGNAANLSGATKTFAGLQIDTVTPVITQVVTSPSSGDIGLGKTVTVTLDFSKAVTVKGAPKLTLNDGGTATYTSGSGTAALTFTYTVSAGQNTADLQATGITLPAGASIKDSAGHTANLAGATANLGLQINSIAPVISAVSSSPSTANLNAGKTVAISLAMSEPVTVTGDPTLTLNDGGTATFNAAHSTPTNLVFDYSVASGQNAAALKVTKLNLPTGSSIQDLAGNTASATLPASATLAIQIDTKAPTVTAASASTSSKDLNAGKTAEITLIMSEAVVVSGTPTLTLNDGGIATYDAALSSATALTFDYTVVAGQNTSNLKITGVNLPSGASIQDLAGNAGVLTRANVNLGLQVDTLTPAVSGVTSAHQEGTAVGAPITITIKTNEAVTVSGTPELLLSDGGIATYDPTKSTSTSLVFDYTVAKNQGTGTAPLSIIGTELPSPNGIQDGAGNIGALQLSAAQANLGFTITSTPAGAPTSVTISGTSEAEIFGASSQNVTFASGADGTLKLDAATAYTGKVSGLALGDTLDLANLAYDSHMTVGYSGNAAGGVLSVSNGSQTANIALLGNYMASTFTLGSDGHGGTTVVDPPMIASTPLAVTAKPQLA